MKRSVQDAALAEYAFHLEVTPERVTFTRQLTFSGWLLHRRGQPIYGIRAVVSGVLWRRSLFRARRKRSRPTVAAAYPDLPEAGQSGFLLEVEAHAGRNRISIQVQDHEKIWRTIFSTDVWAFPLSFLGRIGLPRLEQFLVTELAQVVASKSAKARTSDASLTAQDGRRLISEGLDDPAVSTERKIQIVHLFVTSKSNLFIREIAELLCAGFKAAGCDTQLFVDEIPAERTEQGKIQMVVTPHEFFNLFLNDKLPREKIQRLATHLLLLGTEQPESEWFLSNLALAPHARAMLDIHRAGVAAYRARGLRCFHLPLGYDSLLEQATPSGNFERNVDICFLAAMTKRREKFIAAHADLFAAHSCHLRFVPIEFAKTEQTRSYLPPLRRNALLQEARILLNVHYSELRYFEWHRALVALANRCCFITETCEGFEPFVPGKHFVMAKADELPACCEYYLHHDNEREEMAQAAYTFMREHFTQEDNCREFLRQVSRVFAQQDAGTSLPVSDNGADETGELKIQPMPHRLAKRLSQRRLSSFFSALREDISSMFLSAKSSRDSGIGAALDPAQRTAAICEVRRGYIERLEAQQEAERNRQPTFQLIDNARVDAAVPAISVIVTLYNYGAYIQQCIKSLEDSNTASILGGIEIVIVNDASSDDSLERAMALQRDSRHPVRIIDKRLNTGLADARNLALQVARGRYVFILDADNMLFPRALEQLHAIAVKHNPAAVYSMLCRFEGTAKTREGLLSYFDWDPEMLVEYPYIDAMALFDRAQLIEIGGYDTELFKFGWFGWEDYDLWLRIAEADLPVIFLPNVLCLYRQHKRSMSNTTNLFERELVTRLIEKHRLLVESYPPKKRRLGVNRARLEKAQGTISAALTQESAVSITVSPR